MGGLCVRFFRLVGDLAPSGGGSPKVGCGFGLKMSLSGLLAGFSRTFGRGGGCGRGTGFWRAERVRERLRGVLRVC